MLSILTIVDFSILLIFILTFETNVCKQPKDYIVYNSNELQKNISFENEKNEMNSYDVKFLNMKNDGLSFNRKTLVNNSGFQFLYDIYSNAIDERKAKNYNISIQDLKIIKQSDIIVTYKPSNLCNNIEKSLWFDISNTPSFDSLIKAELRIYQESSNYNSIKYELYQPYNSIKNQKTILKLIDAIWIPHHYKGWIKFDATDALNTGLNDQIDRHKLHLLINSYKEARGCSDKPNQRTFLIGYFKKSSSSPILTKILNNQSSITRKSITTKRSTTELSSNQTHNCRLNSLYVNFREFEFDNLIVAPEGYEAGYCSGQCYFPISSKANATNHAIVQTYVNFLKPDEVPAVCCVPDRLDDLHVIYARSDSSDGGDAVFMTYRNMIARSCGCR